MMHDDNPEKDLDPVADAGVTRALDLLGAAEPPPGLVSQVMWRAKHHATQDRAVQDNKMRRVSRRTGEGVVMAKKVLVGLAAVAAIGLAVVYIGGVEIPPTGKTEGTIGAAQRYQAEQIQKSDVKVENPELQAFMQTDVFDKLIHDKQAVAALASPAVQSALANRELQVALSSPAFQSALASPTVQQALASPEVSRALSAPAVQQAMANPSFQVALQSQGVQSALASPALHDVMANPALSAALSSPALVSALSNPAFQQALASPAFQSALVNPTLQLALANPAFQVALSSSAFQGLLASPLLLNGLSAASVQQLSMQVQSLSANGLAVSGAVGGR
jgi:hypothetical protein